MALAALTLLLEPDDLGVRAEAVPGSAVIDGLEVCPHDVADGQGGDDTLLRADCLHGVAPRRPRLQHILLPGPGLPACPELAGDPYRAAHARTSVPPPHPSADTARLKFMLTATHHQYVCT